MLWKVEASGEGEEGEEGEEVEEAGGWIGLETAR
jgi:hypothetical protein